MCPSSDFKWKTKFTIVILTKNGFQKFHTFYSKLLSKIWIFIWNLLRGTWKGFSFDVYMPFITIFIKIKQPFAWHIYFLVRHLRRYSGIRMDSVFKGVARPKNSILYCNAARWFFILPQVYNVHRVLVIARLTATSKWNCAHAELNYL